MEPLIASLYLIISCISLIISPSSTAHFAPSSQTLPLSCSNNPSNALGFFQCYQKEPGNECKTYAVLRTNPYYSSLFNLSFYFGINRNRIAEANGFSTNTEFLPKDQPLLIPIDCKCLPPGLFQAQLERTTVKGDTFETIAQSLQGLTTCRAIAEKNPTHPPNLELGDRARITVPLKCACPSKSDLGSGTKLLLAYPLAKGDTIASLALVFNSTPEAIISANNQLLKGYFSPQNLIPGSYLLIPFQKMPILGSLGKPQEPKLKSRGVTSSATFPTHPKKKKKKAKVGLYVAVAIVAVGGSIAFSIFAWWMYQIWRKDNNSNSHKSSNTNKISKPKIQDVELQKLNLSIRTTSEKKISFEGSQSTFDGTDVTPHKMTLEIYTIEDLKRATEDFDTHNLIEGTVYHGRLKGKNVAIKRTTSDMVSKVDYGLFQDSIHSPPNIIRLLGTCLTEDRSNSFLVFEYTKNGSLKDWIHGGLAMKSQFIASCYCFLTWSQRVRICFDVALALQYMHHIMNPPYCHKNIKSRNVFLDEEFNAKVGNFGMARCSAAADDDDDSRTEVEFCPSNPESWNRGYLAPEFVKKGTVSPSMDIFAFGVILLEVLSGKKPIMYSNDDEEAAAATEFLSDSIKVVLSSEEEGELRGWMDGALGESYSLDEAAKLARLARACLEEDPALRPNAEEVVEQLSGLVEEEVQGSGGAGGGGADCSMINESSSKPLVKAAVMSDHDSGNI